MTRASPRHVILLTSVFDWVSRDLDDIYNRNSIYTCDALVSKYFSIERQSDRNRFELVPRSIFLIKRKITNQ